MEVDEERESLTKLKRQIVAIDKLVNRSAKLEAKLKTTENALNEKNQEIDKLKSELLQCRMSAPTESENTPGSDHQAELINLQEEVSRKESKILQLEGVLGKFRGNEDILRKELKSKNENIVQREIESQALKKQISDLQNVKNRLEEDLANGAELQKLKEKFEETKWGHQAEISRLRQEGASANITIEDLKKTNESLLKGNTDLAAQLESFVKQDKEAERLGKVVEKKEKHIVNLEKKLDQSSKEIDNLKLKLKSKGIVVSQVEEKLNEAEDNEAEVNEENPPELPVVCPTTRPRLVFSKFSFSGPSARFVIERPKASEFRSRKVGFVRKASCVENVPTAVNRKPSISDYFAILSGDTSSTQPGSKRKSLRDTEEPAAKRSKRQPSAPGQSPGQSPVTPTKKRSPAAPVQCERSAPPKKSRTEVPVTPASSESSPEPAKPEVVISPGVSRKPTLPVDVFTEQNPVKSRHAHTPSTTRPGISPLKKLTHKKTDKPNKRFEPKVLEKVQSSPFKLPPQLSPIKSPQVSKPVESQPTPAESSNTSASSPAISSAKAKIFASGLGPRAIEAPTKSVGGRLNQSQLEAAKRRSVPASSVSQMPSVNGFRQSGKEQKQSNNKPEKKPVKVTATDIYCPSRRKTNPAKLSLSVPPSEETVTTPVLQGKENPLPSKKEKCKSKEFVSTESDSSDNEKEPVEKSKSPDPDIPHTEPESLVPEPEITSKDEDASSNLKGDCDDDADGVLDNDLEVSDSDDESDNEIVSRQKITVEVSDEENNERFSKLKSEKVPPEVERCEQSSQIQAPSQQEKSSPKTQFPTKLEELVYNFKVKANSSFQLLKAEREKLTQQRSELMYEATVDLLKKQFGHLMGNQNEKSFKKIVNSLTGTEVMICDLVCEHLKVEHKDTPLLSELFGDQPAITRKQQRLFTFLVTLSQQER